MQLFTYVRAADASAAVQKVASNADANFLAGGTTLLDLMKLDVQKPSLVVDVNRLAYNKIEANDQGITVGANVRNSDLAYDTLVQMRFPMLSQALLSGASAQLRNMASTGGNLMQRTRCVYFRDTRWPCNKRVPGSGCSAIDGFNRMHAVLGTSDQCIATHPSDMAVAMVALDAKVMTLKPGGQARTIPVQDFHVSYGEDPARETVLEHGEMIVGVQLPFSASAERSLYLKVRDRASYEFALASAGVGLELDGPTIKSARVALGGVGTKPWRSPEAEKALVGKQASDQTFTAAADAALQGAKPRKFNAFKIELARRTLTHALRMLAST